MEKEGVVIRYSVHLAAGIATTPDFFSAFCRRLMERFAEVGARVNISFQFPYGDSGRRLAAQTYEVQWDMRLPFAALDRSIGGERMRKNILRRHDGERLFLIGHSAGGIAACHAARMLEETDGIEVDRVVQIGSPKTKVFPTLQDKCAYLKGRGTRGCDRICRLGTWAGWEMKSVIPYWRKDKYAPSLRSEVRLIGGHADYFRDSEAYWDEDGKSNLQKTLDIVWNWLCIDDFTLRQGAGKNGALVEG